MANINNTLEYIEKKQKLPKAFVRNVKESTIKKYRKSQRI